MSAPRAALSGTPISAPSAVLREPHLRTPSTAFRRRPHPCARPPLLPKGCRDIGFSEIVRNDLPPSPSAAQLVLGRGAEGTRSLGSGLRRQGRGSGGWGGAGPGRGVERAAAALGAGHHSADVCGAGRGSGGPGGAGRRAGQGRVGGGASLCRRASAGRGSAGRGGAWAGRRAGRGLVGGGAALGPERAARAGASGCGSGCGPGARRGGRGAMVLSPVIGKLLQKRVVLASASPRRREILSHAVSERPASGLGRGVCGGAGGRESAASGSADLGDWSRAEEGGGGAGARRLLTWGPGGPGA